MNTTTYAVHDKGQQVDVVDGLIALLPSPTNIALQTPLLSAFLRSIAGTHPGGTPSVAGIVACTGKMMRCYTARDWIGFKKLERSGAGCVYGWFEAGLQFGVSNEQLRAWEVRRGR